MKYKEYKYNNKGGRNREEKTFLKKNQNKTKKKDN